MTTPNDERLRAEINKILKREQEYVQQCTLANIDAARTTGQWVIHDPNRRHSTEEIMAFVEAETQKAYWEGIDVMRTEPQADINPKMKAYLEAELVKARIDGRKDAIQCHTIIKQQWQQYRGSSNFLDVGLQTVNEAFPLQKQGEGGGE